MGLLAGALFLSLFAVVFATRLDSLTLALDLLIIGLLLLTPTSLTVGTRAEGHRERWS